MAKTIAQAAYEKLRAASTITNQVSDVYFLEASTAATLPYIVLWTVADPHEPFEYDKTLGGQARIQVDLWHHNKYDGVDLSYDVWKEMQHFQGMQSTKYIRQIRSADERYLVEDDGVYHFVNDFIIDYED